ncbi:MAG: sigma-70 family RNA polymerase sigma factor [Blastocatellia bacterium AA13]|nr:MAG: sigma-70 family RNA polymerase sigma factor [Blastocatellia bacterium AA13]
MTESLRSIPPRARNIIWWGWKGARLSIPTVHQTDDCLRRYAEGDQSAFADIVREHQSMVYSIAYNFLRDRASAEDLAQDVFLHLYKNLSAMKSPEHLRFWLRRVASHRCIDRARRSSLRPQVSIEEIAEPSAPERLKDPLIERMLGRLVETLPEKPRLIVILRYQEDMEPSEIAEALGMPVNTVKSHLRRSLILLREKMARLETKSVEART